MPRPSSHSRRKVRALAHAAKITQPHLYPSQPSEWGAWLGMRGLDVLVEYWEARTQGLPLYRSGTRKEAQAWAENTERENKALPKLSVEMAALPLYSEITEPPDFDEDTGVVDEDERPIKGAPVYASDEGEIDAVLNRVRLIMAELASQVPYGPIKEYQAMIFWVPVLGSRDAKPKRGKGKWWGTGELKDPNQVLKSLRTGLREILERGTTADQLRKYREKGAKKDTGGPSWIEVPRLGLKWVCSAAGKCLPGEREETPEYLKLIGREPSTKKPKAKTKRTRAKKSPKKGGPP